MYISVRYNLLPLMVVLGLVGASQVSHSASTGTSTSAGRSISTHATRTHPKRTGSSSNSNLPGAIVTRVRRILNLSGTFGSAVLSSTPYDRITGHPVFAVTTPWGSPYMNMEKLDDADETVQVESSTRKKQSISEEQNEIRMCALYFLDPNDAIAVHGEMKQMENMDKADIRLTTFSLAKALRQASNLGNGLLTGMPPDKLDGKIQTADGGTLRYKLVPPKKQLYYAARCVGKERVGLFSDSPEADAATAVTGNSALEAANLLRRRDKRERKLQKKMTPAQRQAQHMEGYCGIPVFYCPNMQRRNPPLKRWLSGVPHEIPLFFNYEDLLTAYSTMLRRTHSRHNTIAPTTEPAVEVFNLWDVLSSMDKEQQSLSSLHWSNPLRSFFQMRFAKLDMLPTTLKDVTFVPNSDAVSYKDSISRRGNGKARLPRMR